MSRVSENSNSTALNFNLSKSKSRMEDLQLKGSTLKRVRKPSDDPMANIEAMTITSRNKDNSQYLKNASLAQLHLNATEDSLVQITETLMKAKDLAIQQSSDFYDDKIRKNIANEVFQLRNHALSVANKRIGNKYIFGGFSTLSKPFESDGSYKGDNGHITIEISKDFFVPINLTGEEVFFFSDTVSSQTPNPLDEFPIFENSRNKLLRDEPPEEIKRNQEFIDKGRDLASTDAKYQVQGYRKKSNIFALLSMLTSALENNQPKVIQNLLVKMDDSISRLITMRTKIGSISRSVQNSINSVEMDTINNKARRSELVDADIADLFSDIQKNNDTLQAAYKVGNATINQSLLNFIK
ncbi:MAG: flagellar hook-associated protein FlgL [Bdellovibrionales bacterium]|jgi:flagellar hook-associated protein 3 FlgL|nr:flagellar hook-associated protein FlgL [Bdellovibrionales bacterium]